MNNVQDLRAPLNELLKKEEKCQETFQRIKDVLTSELFLTYFDSKVKLILVSDTNNVGIGAMFLHKEKLGV